MPFICRTVCDGDKNLDVASAVERIVDSAPSYYAGEIETLRARLDKTVGLVAALIGQMPVEQAVELLNEHSCETFRWEQTK